MGDGDGDRKIFVGMGIRMKLWRWGADGENPRESGRHGKNRGDRVVMGSVTVSLSSCTVTFLSLLNTCVCVCV